MYALISSGQVAEFPLSLNKWRFENPLISLPQIPTEEQLNEVGIYLVQSTPKPPEDYTLNYESTAVQSEDGSWVESWTETPASEEEIVRRIEKKSQEVRKLRNELLVGSDWTQNRDVILDNDADWTTYRQELRDITEQSGFPWEVVWPEQP